MYDTKSTGKTNYYTNKLRQSSNSLHNYNNDSFNVVNPNSPTFISTKSLQFFDPQTQLTEKEKNDILTIINMYKEISTSFETLIKSITEIQNNINEYEDEMEQLKSKENEMMSDLRTKYGNFSLQDVFDTLYNS